MDIEDIVTDALFQLAVAPVFNGRQRCSDDLALLFEFFPERIDFSPEQLLERSFSSGREVTIRATVSDISDLLDDK